LKRANQLKYNSIAVKGRPKTRSFFDCCHPEVPLSANGGPDRRRPVRRFQCSPAPSAELPWMPAFRGMTVMPPTEFRGAASPADHLLSARGSYHGFRLSERTCCEIAALGNKLTQYQKPLALTLCTYMILAGAVARLPSGLQAAPVGGRRGPLVLAAPAALAETQVSLLPNAASFLVRSTASRAGASEAPVRP